MAHHRGDYNPQRRRIQELEREVEQLQARILRLEEENEQLRNDIIRTRGQQGLILSKP